MFKKSILILFLMISPALAQDPQPATPQPAEAKPAEVQDEESPKDTQDGFITLDAGIHFTTHYLMRGIPQEDKGVIGQPWIELQMHLYRGNGFITDMYLYGRSWNSFHSGPTGTEDNSTSDRSSWYETQFTAGGGLEFFHVLTVSGGYTFRHSPNDSFVTSEELFVRGTIQDKRLWNLSGDVGGWKLEFEGVRPHGMFAWETSKQRDNGLNRGVYAEVGAEPGLTLSPSEHFSFSLSVPFAVGFNVFEYYEVQNKGDAPFGYFRLGFRGTVPLKFIPDNYGQWSLYGGLDWYKLGQNVANGFNDGENDELIGSGGLVFHY